MTRTQKQAQHVCKACQGTGLAVTEFGYAMEPDINSDEWYEDYWRCPACNGTGYRTSEYDYSTGERLTVIEPLDFIYGRGKYNV